MTIQIKQIYEPVQDSDGLRILVDRMWPRGISKERARLDDWMKSVTPSPELRKWFNHEPAKFARFQEAYQKELSEDEEKQHGVEKLIKLSRTQTVTLLYAAKSPTCNHALVLVVFIKSKENRHDN
ncbi:DUF488 domain-containing protein [Sporolactobacillus shoreicorticis]|uniref:DUF488 domain-containing protein n=1 Tax=Sporolactobacillus shoreicorticis TaxID=1923877 RepID=A0ABW5S1R1_9BACL|nr:DUF488 domain-containing protein [Sporolactobacillus shoreicorticis]MCO7125404.1 DUF488 domain-containing protein [Sporolactobacillus shoreicorticis]